MGSPQQAPQSNQWIIQASEISFGKELGRGAFGVVSKGRWRFTDVAVKVIQGNPSAQDMKAFQDEVALMMNLRPHKNVVQLRGLCLQPLCVVMDFVDGGSLESRLHKREVEVTWREVFKWAQGIVAGLHHCHCEGIVHRDLAARNVLLDSLNNALLSDFGLSSTAGRFGGNNAQNAIQEVGFFRGPYKWMAPESLANNQFSIKSDVWSLGVTLWEILSRRLPFENKTIYQVKDEVVMQHLRLWCPPKWPEMWRNLLVACWRTDPAMRPDCATVARWLEKMYQDFEVAGDQYGPTPAVSDEEFSHMLAAIAALAAKQQTSTPAAPGSQHNPSLHHAGSGVHLVGLGTAPLTSSIGGGPGTPELHGAERVATAGAQITATPLSQSQSSSPVIIVSPATADAVSALQQPPPPSSPAVQRASSSPLPTFDEKSASSTPALNVPPPTTDTAQPPRSPIHSPHGSPRVARRAPSPTRNFSAPVLGVEDDIRAEMRAINRSHSPQPASSTEAVADSKTKLATLSAMKPDQVLEHRAGSLGLQVTKDTSTK